MIDKLNKLRDEVAQNLTKTWGNADAIDKSFKQGWDAALKAAAEMAHRITIGEYTIMPYHDGSFFIQHESGEGMQTSAESLAELIDKYYKENF